MATSLQDFPAELPVKAGPPRKHDWDTWFDGSIWELVEGEDFDCTVASMRPQVYVAARDRHGTAKIRTIRIDNGGPTKFYIQFTKD